MRLTVIGSSSEGNAYVLQSAGEALLLEAGLPFGKVLRAIGYELGKVAGCRDTLLANDLSKVNNIVLLHLSGDHADPAECREQIHRATGRTVHVARPGLTIDINRTPF